MSTPKRKTKATTAQPNEATNSISWEDSLQVALFENYDQVFLQLDKKRLGWIRALCDFDYKLRTDKNGKELIKTEATQKIYQGLITKTLTTEFTLSELKHFVVNSSVPTLPDWRDRLELIEQSSKKTETGGKGRGGKRPGAGRPRAEKKKNTTKQEQEQERKLRGRQREVYNLRKNEGYSYPAIVEKLKITEKVEITVDQAKEDYNAHYRHYVKGKKKTD